MDDKEIAKPFLKWAGGKKRVIISIDKLLPQSIKDSKVIENYCEPFLGGGAVFFHLMNEYQINNIYLGDINKELMLTWNIVKNKPKQLIQKLKTLSNEFPSSHEFRKEFYYDIRENFNENFDDFDYESSGDEQILRASQMIFLNRTCFNGLYRVNKSGKFNVPIGRYKNPLICDEDNLMRVHNILKDVTLVCDDYAKSINFIDDNSFVYLDPPYLPIKKNSFTNYDSKGFGVKEQFELSEFCKEIDNLGAKFILSNSDPKNYDPSCNFFKDVYGDLNLGKCHYEKIEVRRSINSNGNKRGPINELLIYNF